MYDSVYSGRRKEASHIQRTSHGFKRLEKVYGLNEKKNKKSVFTCLFHIINWWTTIKPVFVLKKFDLSIREVTNQKWIQRQWQFSPTGVCLTEACPKNKPIVIHLCICMMCASDVFHNHNFYTANRKQLNSIYLQKHLWTNQKISIHHVDGDWAVVQIFIWCQRSHILASVFRFGIKKRESQIVIETYTGNFSFIIQLCVARLEHSAAHQWHFPSQMSPT